MRPSILLFVRSRGTEIYAANQTPPLVRSEDGFCHGAGLKQAETEQNGVAHNAPNGVDGIPGNRHALDQHRINRHADEDEKAPENPAQTGISGSSVPCGSARGCRKSPWGWAQGLPCSKFQSFFRRR